MADLGDCTLTCPACQAPIVLPLTQSGADLTSITLTIDLSAVRQHIATTHPQEHSMSAFTDKLHAFFSRFAEVSREDIAKVETAVEEKVQPLVAEVRDEYKNDVAALEARLAALEAKIEQILSAGPAAS
ncbi:MAG: hypothetical protein HOY76_19725 [Streptomyces sp.]|nr:hypothetical protein [Streptomyces sp.]